MSRQTYDVSLILVIFIRGDSNLAKKGREKDARNRDTRRSLGAMAARMTDHFENVPLDSTTNEGKVVEGTKTSVITNTLIEFANESLSHEDFFVNSKENYGNDFDQKHIVCICSRSVAKLEPK